MNELTDRRKVMLPARRFNQYGLTDFFNDFFDGRAVEKVGGNTPAVNVMENDKEYKLEVAAPGMCKDDFKIHLNKQGNLVIDMEKTDCGCKAKDEDKKECKYIRKEFSYSRFSQTMILPENADKDGIEATVNNGILYVRIPKTTKEQVEEGKRVIEVK
jgi:HSP20 family protein